MFFKGTTALLSVLCFCGFAQAQSAPPPSPEVQAIGQKLMAEINASVSCTAQAITLKQQLDMAQAELKALKDRPKEKK